jgi:hypothetical protein
MTCKNMPGHDEIAGPHLEKRIAEFGWGKARAIQLLERRWTLSVGGD